MLTLDLLPTQVQADRICPPPGGGSLLLVAMQRCRNRYEGIRSCPSVDPSLKHDFRMAKMTHHHVYKFTIYLKRSLNIQLWCLQQLVPAEGHDSLKAKSRLQTNKSH